MTVLIVVVVAVVLLLAWALSYRATRIDRLHARVDGCWHALDAMLVRRSEALIELTNAGVLDPSSALLLSSAVGEVLDLDGGPDDRAPAYRRVRVAAENELVATAELVLGEVSRERPGDLDNDLRSTLERTSRQVDVATAHYNTAVDEVVAIRRQLVTRLSCLAGKAPRLERIDVATIGALEPAA